MKKQNNTKLERCVFCGRWFRGIEYLTLEEIKEITDKELNNCLLGYCPKAQQNMGLNYEINK